MKLHSALLSTLLATVVLTACQPQSGLVKPIPEPARVPEVGKPSNDETKKETPDADQSQSQTLQKTIEVDRALAEGSAAPGTSTPQTLAPDDYRDLTAPHPARPPKDPVPKKQQQAPDQPLSADQIKVDTMGLVRITPELVNQTAVNCGVQVYQTTMPLPKDVFEKQQGKPMCMVDYVAVRKLHLMASDLDKGVTVAEPERLRFYDQLLVKMHPRLKSIRKFGIEGREKIIAQTWKQMLASMTTSFGTCNLEFRGSGMELDFMANGPLPRVDQETGNPGTRFVMKSEDYEQPSWSLKCPLKSESGEIEMKTVKRGKYFYVFMDMYENEKDANTDHPMQMMKYLLSAQ